MPVGLVWDERYLAHAAPDHPESPARLTAIRTALQRAGLWDDLAHIPPRRATQAELLRVHSRRHVQDVARSAGAKDIVWFDGDTYACPASWDAALLAAGGAFAAADAVMKGGVSAAFAAVRPPGHHATADRAMGFCLLNNVALAVRHVQAAHRIGRVLVVDWDVHHGNGTQNIFLEDPTVFYFSIHEHPTFLYPGTGRRWEIGKGKGEGATLNAPMAPGAGDAEYRTTFEQMLEPAVERFRPEIILVSAGFDAHRDDPLADLQVTEEGFRFMTRHLLALADRFCGGKVVSILEGGYEISSLTSCIELHVRELLGE